MRKRSEPNDEPRTGITVRLDAVLDQRGITLTDLAKEIDITYANLSVLKNGHARAVRFSTLAAICQALDCQPGDLLQLDGA